MPKIRLNERGKEIFPHLANEWLAVYGYDPVSYSFLVWDEIWGGWLYISINHCEGRRDTAVE